MSEPGGPDDQGGGAPQQPSYPYPQQQYPQQQYPHWQYPQWQPSMPPKKTSPAAVALIIGSVVVVVMMVLAFLAWGYPGFLRKPAANAGGGWFTTSPTARTTLVSPTPAETPTVRVPPSGDRAPMPKRTTPLANPVTCSFTPASGTPAPKKATPPPDGPAPSAGTVPVRIATSAGDIGLTLDRALAPCTVVNFLSLAKQGFYDGTSCHRLSVVTGLRMLQCGDPVGDGTGGPGYTIKDETFPELTYGRGVLAMATTAEPDSGGSQFFLVFGEAQIPPSYTVFGSIDDAGLAVLDKVAAGGVDPAAQGIGDGSGPPKIPVTFTGVTTP
ncbi:peptidylprolyl isomerase [Amycolatopsis taiwanensis]|uniref:Peptidyl-prolyl cis-trans isomerase n=1 Tax=Amycolatopsis taiwanensis TaxID=342230 RepID=A0A9W6RCE6_9PSEU|nr:peptidylprolyl isomerase [Amycolatopsis taiwanensis]GLY71522.1 peptidyl-prolyl cis-trans isomerase [Amycolatopsis taiwanensis]